MFTSVIWIFLLFAIVAANLPWLSERFLGIFSLRVQKTLGWCLLEWFLFYLIIGAIAMGLEKKLKAEIYAQDWEFYVVTFCLFLVFALPGFIYRYDLKHLLNREKV